MATAFKRKATGLEGRTRVRAPVSYHRSTPRNNNARTAVFAKTPLKNVNEINGCQGAKIRGPADVIAIEVWAREWRSSASSGGVAVEISRLRKRALA
jgi:hypothetical protein